MEVLHLRNKLSTVTIFISLVFILCSVSLIVYAKANYAPAEVRAILRDTKIYTEAISSFKLQYNALPGDFPAASSYWRNAKSGDGNGKISFFSHVSTNESVNSWAHLSHSQLLDSLYTNYEQGQPKLNLHIPGLLENKSLWPVHNPFKYEMGHSFVIAEPTNTISAPFKGAVSPSAALLLDKKIDNSYSTSGNVRGISTKKEVCANAGVYQTTNNTKSCILIISFESNISKNY